MSLWMTRPILYEVVCYVLTLMVCDNHYVLPDRERYEKNVW